MSSLLSSKITYTSLLLSLNRTACLVFNHLLTKTVDNELALSDGLA